jgi:hypothetical protein
VRGKLRDKRAEVKRDRFKFKRELEGRRRLARRERDYRDLDEWLEEQLADEASGLSNEDGEAFDGRRPLR